MVKLVKTDSTEEKILISAKKNFLKNGMAGARMQDIADEAGINKALLHYYFRTKEKLFEVIFREAASNFFPQLEGIISAEAPLSEKIQGFCSAYIDMLLQNPFLPMFVLTESNNQPQRFRQKLWKNRGHLFMRFAADVNNEIKKKNIKPVDPGQLFMNMIALCIFPFLAKPIWQMTTGMGETEFRRMIEERKKIIPQLINDSIKK
ncbi:MAG: TetR/AcrR family transcriptional regulator [Bacteroidetes bacterium]|nr:TetR/AcrR family transcriptional regulator [Bacteroidota bacterium]MBS1973999.1 TetR/AcrR family transcriptional regulator [Bacteroidota bacterium]